VKSETEDINVWLGSSETFSSLETESEANTASSREVRTSDGSCTSLDPPSSKSATVDRKVHNGGHRRAKISVQTLVLALALGLFGSRTEFI
jgi:hypothetical protein